MTSSNIYDQTVTDWEKAYDTFLKQPDWPGTEDLDQGLGVSANLRKFWQKHGCVRCRWETHLVLDEITPIIAHDDESVWISNFQKKGNKWSKRAKLPEDTKGIIKWLQKRVADWEKPGVSKKVKFYCNRHIQELRCAAALRYSVILQGALDAGHMAWAYEAPAEWKGFLDGKYAPWRVGEVAGWGASNEVAAEDLDDQWKGTFNEYKLMLVEDGNFEEALLRAIEVVAEATWEPIENNCNAAVGQVLTGFGAELPSTVPLESIYYHFLYGAVHQLGPIAEQPPAPPTPPTTPEPAPRPDLNFKSINHAISKSKKQLEKKQAQLSATCMSHCDETSPVGEYEELDDADDAVLIDRIFELDSESLIHLTPDCPALARSQPQPVGIAPYDDFAALETALERALCQMCVKMVMADSRLLNRFECCTDHLGICVRRLRVDGPKVAMDIPFYDVINCRKKGPGIIEKTAKIEISYEHLSPEQKEFRKRSVELSFESQESRDDCLEAICQALETRTR